MATPAPQNTIDDSTFDSIMQGNGIKPVAPPTGPQDWYSNMQSTVAQRERNNQDNSFMGAIMGKSPESSYNMPSVDVAKDIVHGVGQIVQHPIEATKGAVKNIAATGAGVINAADTGITADVNALGGDIGKPDQGGILGGKTMLDYKPVQEATQYSNDAQSAGGMASNFIPVGEGAKVAKTGITTVAPHIDQAIDVAGNFIKPLTDAVGNVASKAKGSIGKVTDNLKNPFTIKSDAEILSTAPDKIATLKPAERDIYATLKKQQVDNEMSTLNSQLEAEHGAKMEALQTESKDLANKASTASYEEAQSLKPKVLDQMKRSSQEYQNLVEQELAPVKDTQVTTNEINSYVRTKYADDPQKAEDIISTLTKGANDKPTTVGDIYNNMKGLQQDIGSAAKKGSRTFTTDEMKTTDAISTLSNFLKDEKGVDLSKANAFWKDYAPKRNEMIKYIQPFAQRGLETGNFTSFANSIRGAVEGTKPMEGDFIKQVENFTGEKIGNPQTREALAKLTQNQKEQVLAQTEKALKADAIKASAKGEKAQIDSQIREANAKQYFKDALKKYIPAILTGEGIHKVVTGSF